MFNMSNTRLTTRTKEEREAHRKAYEQKQVDEAKAKEKLDDELAKFPAITMEDFKGQNSSIVGFASGTVVESKNAIADFGASFKNAIGGELRGYSHLVDVAKEEAIKRMKLDAKQQGADAIVALRVNVTPSGPGNSDNMVTAVAYGTAIKFEDTKE